MFYFTTQISTSGGIGVDHIFMGVCVWGGGGRASNSGSVAGIELRPPVHQSMNALYQTF